MKKIIGLMIFTCLFFTGFSQNNLPGKINYSLGIEAGSATGDNLILWGFGIGASGQAEYFFSKSFAAVASAGYVGYLGKSIRGSYKQKTYNTVPVTIGGNYYLTDAFHIGIQAGIVFISGGASLLGSDGNYLAYTPQIGYRFSLKNKKGIDLTAKYNVYNNNYNFSAPLLRIAYCF